MPASEPGAIIASTTSTASWRITRRFARPSSSIRLSSAPTPGAWTSIAEEVGVGPGRGDRRGGLAHAAADLEHDRRARPKTAAKSSGARVERQREARRQRLERARLRRREAALAQHEAAHRPVRCVVRRPSESARRLPVRPARACARSCARRRPTSGVYSTTTVSASFHSSSRWSSRSGGRWTSSRDDAVARDAPDDQFVRAVRRAEVRGREALAVRARAPARTAAR